MAMGLTSSRPLIEYTLHTPDEVWMESSGRVRGLQMEDESVEGRMIGRDCLAWVCEKVAAVRAVNMAQSCVHVAANALVGKSVGVFVGVPMGVYNALHRVSERHCIACQRETLTC
jgi:hypothetical protein